MQNIYALGLVDLYKKIFLINFYNSFWLPWQPDFGMGTTLEALHLRINPAKFG
jgi:hypothetical protein